MILYLILSNLGTWKLEFRTQPASAPGKISGTGVPLGTGSPCHFTGSILPGPVQDRSGPVQGFPGPVRSWTGLRPVRSSVKVPRLFSPRSRPVRSGPGPSYTPSDRDTTWNIRLFRQARLITQSVIFITNSQVIPLCFLYYALIFLLICFTIVHLKQIAPHFEILCLAKRDIICYIGYVLALFIWIKIGHNICLLDSTVSF